MERKDSITSLRPGNGEQGDVEVQIEVNSEEADIPTQQDTGSKYSKLQVVHCLKKMWPKKRNPGSFISMRVQFIAPKHCGTKKVQ